MVSAVRGSIFPLCAVLLLGVQCVSYACNQRQPTRATSPGPHDFSTAPAETQLWREGDFGQPLFLRGRILDTCGAPVAGARVRILHADQDGQHDPNRWRAHLDSDERGAFKIVTVLPGYAGTIGRHMHFVISHPDHEQLVTRLYFNVDPTVDHGAEELTVVLEEIPRGEDKAWVAGYEFVLKPN